MMQPKKDGKSGEPQGPAKPLKDVVDASRARDSSGAGHDPSERGTGAGGAIATSNTVSAAILDLSKSILETTQRFYEIMGDCSKETNQRMDSNFTAVNAELARIGEGVVKLTGDATKLGADVDRLDLNLDKLGETCGKSAQDIVGLRGELDKLSAILEILQAAVAAASQKVDDSYEKLLDLIQNLGKELKEEMDRRDQSMREEMDRREERQEKLSKLRHQNTEKTVKVWVLTGVGIVLFALVPIYMALFL